MSNLYEVTTEGDCEGRSSRSLGIWEGNISNIAFHLADKMVYSLRFEPITINKPNKISKEKVVISSWKLKDDIINPRYLGAGDFRVEKGGCYNGYTLYIGEEVVKAQKRAELLKEKERIEKELRSLNR